MTSLSLLAGRTVVCTCTSAVLLQGDELPDCAVTFCKIVSPGISPVISELPSRSIYTIPSSHVVQDVS